MLILLMFHWFVEGLMECYCALKIKQEYNNCFDHMQDGVNSVLKFDWGRTPTDRFEHE